MCERQRRSCAVTLPSGDLSGVVVCLAFLVRIIADVREQECSMEVGMLLRLQGRRRAKPCPSPMPPRSTSEVPRGRKKLHCAHLPRFIRHVCSHRSSLIFERYTSGNHHRKMGVPLPSFPYPPPRDGYWGPVTSTLNWCEEVGYWSQNFPSCVSPVDQRLPGLLCYPLCR